MHIQLSYIHISYTTKKPTTIPHHLLIFLWYANFCQKCPLSAGLKFQHHLLLLLFQVASPLFHPPAQSTLTSSLDDGTSNNDDLTSKNGDLTRKKMCFNMFHLQKLNLTSKHEDLTSKRGVTVLHQNGEYSNLWPFKCQNKYRHNGILWFLSVRQTQTNPISKYPKINQFSNVF